MEYREEEGKGEKKNWDNYSSIINKIYLKKEKHQSVASCMHTDWGLNPQPFAVPGDAPTN